MKTSINAIASFCGNDENKMLCSHVYENKMIFSHKQSSSPTLLKEKKKSLSS